MLRWLSMLGTWATYMTPLSSHDLKHALTFVSWVLFAHRSVDTMQATFEGLVKWKKDLKKKDLGLF